jgi:hypothetical protein
VVPRVRSPHLRFESLRFAEVEGVHSQQIDSDKMTTIEYIIERLWQRPIPDAVFHYTSPAGLLGIVDRTAIRATDIAYLNDSQEFVYALSLMRGRVEELLREEDMSAEAPCLREFQRALDQAPRIRIYAASFSANRDQLSQWRAYCPSLGGFAIGVPTANISEPTGCLLLPCIYDRDAQDVLCEELLDSSLELWRSRGAEVDQKSHLYTCGADFISAFFMLASVLKDPGFAEEEEWRLVRRSSSGVEEGGFREGRSGVVPYVELALRRGINPLSLATVVVGPNPHPELAQRAVEELLRVKGVTCSLVSRSAIPFRSW